MTQPIHIPYETPEVRVLDETVRGGLRYRLLIDADHGPSGEVTQGLFYLDGGYSEKRHSHNVTETLHVVAGTGTIAIEDREIGIKTGDAVFVPAGHRHALRADDDLTLFFTFPVDRMSEVRFDGGEAA